MDDLKALLQQVGQEVKQRFDAQKRVLSFTEYLELVIQQPRRHTRDAARYLKDCLDYFGSYEVRTPGRTERRWKVFDLDFGDLEPGDERGGLERRDRLVGHQGVQLELYRILESFEREGRANRLILLHGPNGSAKSTFDACLMRGLERYSATDEGALYRFSWIFPRTDDGKGIGFTTTSDELGKSDSYALLPEERVVAKMPSSIREHPLLLLPRDLRQKLISSLYESDDSDLAAPDWVWSGQLGSKNKQIFEALLTAYRGDLERVLAHVQVERFYVSQRYRVGAVTIGPEMAVDASERQITADRSLEALPASLSALTLYEPFGELVDASGGIVEYSDLLKRPLDAWKYLLLAIENGEVSLTMSNLPINAVMIASSNELHLAAFKEHPEYNSFRGRLVLVRVPYLLNVREEQGIYDGQIIPHIPKHVAPHTTYLAALWAILTRLHRPNPDRYADNALGKAATDLTPLEKADLISDYEIPTRLEAEEAKVLTQGIGEIRDELATTMPYEGIIGASPRAIRMLLLDASADPEEPCLSPMALLSRIAKFCERDDYDFLKLEVENGYNDAKGFVEIVRNRWFDLVESELRESSGLIDEGSYLELFDRYVTHVSHWVKKERVHNPVTGGDEEPDQDLMKTVEGRLDVDNGEAFRNDLLGAVAAYALDHPDEPVDYERLFPKQINRLRQAYFEDHRSEIGRIGRAVVALIDEDDALKPDERELAQQALLALKSKYGYENSSAKIAVGAVIAARYSD